MKIHETKICQILFALLLSASIVFGTMKYSYWNDEFPKLLKYRLPNNTVPNNYSIHLSLDADASVINSEAVITIHILKKIKFIYFHYVGTIKEAILLDYKDLEMQHVPTVSFIKDTTIVNLHFKDILEPGIYFLHISCISRPPIGLSNFKIPNFMKSSKKDLYMATTFQPIGARYLFPCWDEPGIKAPFIITVKNYRNYTIYSNMPMIKQHMHNEYFVTRFEKTPEMSTYQVAIAIVLIEMPIIILNAKNTLRCREYAKSHLEHIYRDTEVAVTQKLASYNMNKMDHIVIPFIQKESIANPGLVVYREDAVMYDENLDSIAHKLEVKRLITRTLTSAWLNFYISPSWWTYLWLYEGFPIFFQTKISKEKWMKNLFVVQTRHESLHLDNSSNMMALENNKSPEDIFLCPHALYVKAPVILYMLENIISPRIFHHSILRYINKYKYEHTSSNDLWHEMQFALNNLNVTHNNYVLKNVMHTWIKQQNYPIVKVEKNDWNQITICLQHLKTENKNFYTNGKWWIPITSTIESEIDFSYTVPYAWLTPQKSCITLHPIRKTNWIIVNIQQTGYYRVNYEQWNWQLIANYLNSEKYINIHVLNRAQLIDDAYYFMMMGELDFHTFLSLTNYLSQETDYIAWYPMLKIFEYLSYLIPFKESKLLKEHMLKILNGVLEKIKYEEFQNEDDLIKCLRQELTKWACLLNDFHCKKVANNKLIKHLKNPKQNKLLPSWKDWTYCHGLSIASRITWLKFWNMYNETNSDQVLRMFLCSRDVINPHFQYNMQLLTNSIHRTECINVLYNIIMRNIGNNLMIILANIQDHILFCTYKLFDMVKVFTVIINNLYSIQQIKTIQTFVGLYIIEILSYVQPMINARLNYVIQQMTLLTKWFKKV